MCLERLAFLSGARPRLLLEEWQPAPSLFLGKKCIAFPLEERTAPFHLEEELRLSPAGEWTTPFPLGERLLSLFALLT